MGGRYSQRWSNGYGDRYGLSGGERYGLQHRWGMYNGIGKGNPSSKGSNMGYGIGTNAQVPELYWVPEDDHYDYYDDDYYYDDYYYGDEYGYEDYGDYYADDDYTYEEEEYPVEEVEVPSFEDSLFPAEDVYFAEEEEEPVEEYSYYDDGADSYEDSWDYDYGYDYYPEEDYYYYDDYHYDDDDYFVDWAAGYGQYDDQFSNPVGQGYMFHLDFGNGHGNHSPWHNEYERNHLGMMEYYGRPKSYEIHHQPQGFYNN
jgi:hypothetical protein